MNMYVGNLSFETTEEDLREAFGEHGTVDSAAVITDRYTGEPRGYGFVEMADQAEAQAALEALNGAELKGRELRVEEARPRSGRRGGRGDRGGRGGGDRGGREDRGDRSW